MLNPASRHTYVTHNCQSCFASSANYGPQRLLTSAGCLLLSSCSLLPHIIVLLDVDLVKHHILLLGIYVGFHLHGNVSGKHREEEAFLQKKEKEISKRIRREGDITNEHQGFHWKHLTEIYLESELSDKHLLPIISFISYYYKESLPVISMDYCCHTKKLQRF